MLFPYNVFDNGCKGLSSYLRQYAIGWRRDAVQTTVAILLISKLPLAANDVLWCCYGVLSAGLVISRSNKGGPRYYRRRYDATVAATPCRPVNSARRRTY